jgi:hypothetical protein
VPTLFHEALTERIGPIRQTLMAHPRYRGVSCLESLQCFMRFHSFAVWDFMCLLKSLQRRLTCVELPWLPPPAMPTPRD